MLLCTKFRLQANEADAAAMEFMEFMEFMQSKRRAHYNWWIMRLRDGERRPGWVEAQASLQASGAHDPELRFVYGKLLHDVSFRLDWAMAAFFRRVTVGETPGFPCVWPQHAFFLLCSPAMYVTVEGNQLTLPTGGSGTFGRIKRYPNIVARLTEPAPANYREIAISRDARGNSYASFVTERPEVAPRPSGVVTFDRGIKTLAAGLNEQGRVYTVGGFKEQQWGNRQLDRTRSTRDRCQKKQRVSERKRHKQRDCLRQAARLIAHRLIETTVVMGDLAQRQMGMKAHQEKDTQQRRRLHRAVFNDWGRYRLGRMLEYKRLGDGWGMGKNGIASTSDTCPRSAQAAAIARQRRCGHERIAVERVGWRWIVL